CQIFFFQAEDGIRYRNVTGVQTCALPILELYTMMRYLQYDLLKSSGLEHFDSWAANFGETTTSLELAPEGTGFRSKTRFAKFFRSEERRVGKERDTEDDAEPHKGMR